MIRLLAIALAFLVVLAKAPVWADGTPLLPLEAVIVETERGTTSFQAEIADTPEERSTGLMFRDSMPDDHGMLFDFGKPRLVTMWMKDTTISLDMIFADPSGLIVGVTENTVPLSTDTISSGGPVKAVFEVNAGTARRLGLKPGGRLVHRIFGNQG